MRVLMLAYAFYETDTRILQYAEALTQRGATVEVISLRKEGQPAEEVQRGVHVFRIQRRPYTEKSKASYLFPIMAFFFKSMWTVICRQSRARYDVVHVHSVPDFLVFAACPAKWTGAKVILDIHDLLPEFYSSKFNAREDSFIFKILVGIERVSCSFADHVILANHLWKDRVESRAHLKGKCSVFLNYPDSTLFQGQPRTRSDDKIQILFPGSLNWHQGVDIAIRAFAQIRDQVPEAEFHIHGEGGAKNSLIELVRQLGLEDCVLFHPFVPVEEIAPVMANADLAVVPKRKDSFGNEAFSTKILEFMSLGVPVIVSDTKIDRYYFNESVVRFFRGSDENDLAEAMLQLIRDPRLREQLVQNAAQFVTSFDWAKKKSEYFALVDSLVSRQACPAEVSP